jgi:predicted RNA-binding Zn-ribbon protein involved in translation (DUF1610 family)
MKQVRNKFDDDTLIESYNRHKHLGKISAELKVPVVQIWRKCKVLGLQFSKGGGKRVGIPLDEILEGLHPYYQTLKLKKRIIREKILEYKCDSCGISEWEDKPITLQLDHINGDSSDHTKSNLRLLCPNCHSQTDTWCGRNK